MNFSDRKVVITGFGVESPVGSTSKELLSSLDQGKAHFSIIESEKRLKTKTRFAGFLKNLDISVLPDKKIKKTVTRKDLIGIIASIKAAQHASVFPGSVNPERFGMYTGAGSTDVSDLSPYYSLVEGSLKTGKYDASHFGANLLGGVNPMVMLQTLMNNTLCYAAVALDIRGVNANFMDFQASGLRAVGEGFRSIVANRADIVLAGGVSSTPESFHSEEGIRMGYLAQTDNLDFSPEDAIKPYDKKRSGTILSEGASFVVLEEEEHALRRNAKIYAQVLSYGTASDANFAFLKNEKSKGLEMALNYLYLLSNRRKDETSFIIGNGNGSIYGDSSEALTLNSFYNKNISQIPVTSTKSVTGEMSEASSTTSLIVAIESLHRGHIPPTKNYSEKDLLMPDLNISFDPQAVKDGLGIVFTRSFSGISCCLMISRY